MKSTLYIVTRLFYSVLLAASFTLLSACSSDDDDDTTNPIVGRGTKPAVMVSVIGSSPGPRTTYVGAFENVPTGTVGNSGMLEFGNAYFYASDGSIFVWDRDAVTVTRYEVADDMKLTKGATISFANFGFKYGADLTFISPTKAIMMVSEQDKVIVWDPSKMEITTSFAANIPVKTGFDNFPIPIGVSGNFMYYSIFYSNYDDLKCYPKYVVAAVPLNADGPVTLFEDDRTIPGLGGYIASNGDIYVIGDGDAGNFAGYGSASYPPPGILRIKAGQTSFDKSYFVDLEKATGSPAMSANWKIDDQTLLTRVWDPATPLPAAVADYFAGQNFVSKKIDIQSGAVTDFPALAKGGFSSNIQDFIDNTTYFPLPAADGSADIAYRLQTAGIQEAYRIPGAGYWGMKRVR